LTPLRIVRAPLAGRLLSRTGPYEAYAGLDSLTLVYQKAETQIPYSSLIDVRVKSGLLWARLVFKSDTLQVTLNGVRKDAARFFAHETLGV